MTDVLTPEQRHRCMSSIKSKNTKPELIVRSLLHKTGYRFRLHYKNLPGKPDIVFPKKRKVIFIHGCFWHKHNCPQGNSTPRTNINFWQSKRDENAVRDRRNITELIENGWKQLIIWECWVKDLDCLKEKLINFLDN